MESSPYIFKDQCKDEECAPQIEKTLHKCNHSADYSLSDALRISTMFRFNSGCSPHTLKVILSIVELLFDPFIVAVIAIVSEGKLVFGVETSYRLELSVPV